MFALLSTIFTILITPILSKNCIFLDSITNEYELDLSPLANLYLTFNDGIKYNYTYSVCANDLLCIPLNEPTAFVSISSYEFNTSYTDECWWLAKWDNGAIQPKYDPAQQIWQFEYEGMPCAGNDGLPRNTTIEWRCNPQTEYQIIGVTETQICEYTIIIDSIYACTDIPSLYCKWFGNRNTTRTTLDLTSLTNITIIGNDASNSEIVFAYTPCRNGTKCLNDDVMVKKENVTSSVGCDSYLAIWEEDINGGVPTYDAINGVWRFEYVNGETCNGLDNSLFIYWNCDESVVNPPYKVITADLIEPCLYDIAIASSLACN